MRKDHFQPTGIFSCVCLIIFIKTQIYTRDFSWYNLYTEPLLHSYNMYLFVTNMNFHNYVSYTGNRQVSSI